MKYTEQAFNEAMARLDGYIFREITEDGSRLKDIGFEVLKNGEHQRNVLKQNPYQHFNYHNDLNLLMPLAWKHDIDPVHMRISHLCANEALTDEEHIQEIRDRLWSLTHRGK